MLTAYYIYIYIYIYVLYIYVCIYIYVYIYIYIYTQVCPLSHLSNVAIFKKYSKLQFPIPDLFFIIES